VAQRIFIAKPKNQFKYEIGDEDLWLFEFQDFFEMLKYKFDFSIDGYSGAILKFDKNREVAQLISNKIHKIEDSFPTVKQSKKYKNKQISKVSSVKFFDELLSILDEAYELKSDIFINGE